MDVAEHDGMLPGAAHTQIGLRFKFRAGPFQTDVGGGDRFDVEGQIAEKRRVCGWTGDALLGVDEHTRDLEPLREGDALDGDAAGKQGGVGRPGETQSAAGQPAHSFRITDADARGARSDVVAQRAVGITHRAGERERAAAGLGSDVLEEEARRVEDEVAGEIVEPGGKIAQARGGVFDVHSAGDARAIERAFEISVDLRRAAGFELRKKAGQQTEIPGAVEAQRELARAREANRAGHSKVGVRAAEGGLINAQLIAGRPKPHGPGVFQTHIRVVEHQAGQIGVNRQALRTRQRAAEKDFSVRVAVAGQLREAQGGLHEGVEVHVLHKNFSGEREFAFETNAHRAGEFAHGHGGIDLELGFSSVRREIALEAADHFMADAQVYDAEGAFATLRDQRPLRIQVKAEFAAHGQALQMELLEIFERERRTDEIEGGVTVSKTVTR